MDFKKAVEKDGSVEVSAFTGTPLNQGGRIPEVRTQQLNAIYIVIGQRWSNLNDLVVIVWNEEDFKVDNRREVFGDVTGSSFLFSFLLAADFTFTQG